MFNPEMCKMRQRKLEAIMPLYIIDSWIPVQCQWASDV